MKKILLLLVIIIPTILSLSQWFECTRFADTHYFSKFDLELRLIESIHNDQGADPRVTRAFHNKATGAIFDVSRIYIRYVDPIFLITLLGFGGMIAMVVGLYTLIREERQAKWKYVPLSVLGLLPLIELLAKPPISFPLKIVMFISLCLFLIYFGINKVKERFIPVLIGYILLGLLTIWWNSVFSPQLLSVCLK